MKRLVIISLLLMQSWLIKAQGLEDVIVETYYITDAGDAREMGVKDTSVKFVTYRIFLDMKPGYNFQSAYGAPGHDMILRTSTSFYNHTIHGQYIPNLVMVPLLPGGALMLDSWISAGAGSQQQYAVLKADDDTLGTVQNLSRPVCLQSQNPLAGIPLNKRDGLMRGDTLPPRVTQVGMDALLNDLYKTPTAGAGYEFKTANGGWGCLGGSKGLNPETNRVLIGQFTTDGDFYFEFNVQIGSVENGIEQYVARNPVDKEQLHKNLIISKSSLNKNKIN